MKIIFLKAFILCALSNVYAGSFADIIDVREVNDRIVLEISYRSDEQIFTPENILNKLVSYKFNVFGEIYTVFLGYLIQNNRGNYTLLISNENYGQLRFIRGSKHFDIYNAGITFKRFPEYYSSKIVLDKLYLLPLDIDIESVASEIRIDEIYFEYCYTKNVQFENKRPVDFDNYIAFFNNNMKYALTTFKLDTPILWKSAFVSNLIWDR